MHVHLPKPIHGWRQFFGEVGIIVLGVLIALGAEQVVESYHWQEKVHAADEAMTAEIDMSLRNTIELNERARCSADLRAAFDAALVRKDWARAAAIRRDPAFTSRHFWSEDAYTATVAGQLSDHFNPERLKAFAGVYTMIRKIRQHQEDGWTTDAAAQMLSIPGLPKSDAVMLDELHAAARFDQSVTAMEGQAALLQDAASRLLGLRATMRQFLARPASREAITQCRAAATRWTAT